MSKKLIGILLAAVAAVVVIVLLILPGEEPANELPVFAGVSNASIVLDPANPEEFDPLAGVSATDLEDGDLTAEIVVKSNNLNVSVVGTYTIVYEVTDSEGAVVTATRTVTVTPPSVDNYPLAQYQSGVDLSKLDASQKAIIFAAAESYLLENVYAGVPLYTRASRVMYSERVQLFSPEYNGVLGFGTAFSQLTQDDSNVLMFGSTYGQAGEYTWRSSYNTDPVTLNPWLADDSSTSDFIDTFTGALYDFYFDSTKTGYEILPSLAAELPLALNPTTINGKDYAKVWRIELRTDLEWMFHPETDTSALAAGYEKLDANDYIWTWKEALDNQWFRAISGGGDFIAKGIKGVEDYVAGNASWESVGLRLIDDYTIELEYTNEVAAFDVLYGFAGGSLQAINQELYEALGGEEGYGQGPTTVAASGVYYFDTFTPGQLLLFKKNELHPDAAMYYYTGQQYRFIDGSDAIFAEFIAGRLESAAVPASEVENYLNDPRVKTAPDATTWRLMINSFGTEEARDAFIAEYPSIGLSEDFVPEPILSYLPMRQALYYGFDRYDAAVNVVKLYLPAHTLFAPTYFLDGESGLSVRGTEVGQAVVDDFGGSSNGFVPDAAVDLFKEAVAEAIADGFYQPGTAQAYTTIELVLTYSSSGNTSAQAMVAYIEQQYEELLVDDVNFINLDIVVNDVAFPGNYYDYMMVANTDLGIGGISGSLLNAPSFLDVFSDDNRGGFTLNWGIDTQTANIPVSYTNLDGEVVYEMWGYNALITALNEKVYVRDGQEQTAWLSEDDIVAAYVDMAGEEFAASEDGAELAQYVLGQTVEELADEEGFDSVIAKIVTTESGKAYLYVISVNGDDYEMVKQSALYTSLEAVLNSVYPVATINKQLTTDADVQADAYIQANYGYQTVAEMFEDNDAPAAYAQAWNVTWGPTYNGTDVYILLQIGDYFLQWVWL
jgi:hypothetical protein